MNSDSLKTDSKEGVEMLLVLENTPIGSTIPDKFMPGVPEAMNWTMVKSEKKYWKLRGSFCGIPFRTIEINIAGHMILLTTMSGVN